MMFNIRNPSYKTENRGILKGPASRLVSDIADASNSNWKKKVNIKLVSINECRGNIRGVEKKARNIRNQLPAESTHKPLHRPFGQVPHIIFTWNNSKIKWRNMSTRIIIRSREFSRTAISCYPLFFCGCVGAMGGEYSVFNLQQTWAVRPSLS